MVYTVPCADNEVSENDLLEQDGAGAMKLFDGTGSAIGVAETDKDSEDNVAMVTRGLKKVKVGVRQTWDVGDKLGVNSTGVVTYSSGTVIGVAAETHATALATSGMLLADLNITN